MRKKKMMASVTLLRYGNDCSSSGGYAQGPTSRSVQVRLTLRQVLQYTFTGLEVRESSIVNSFPSRAELTEKGRLSTETLWSGAFSLSFDISGSLFSVSGWITIG